MYMQKNGNQQPRKNIMMVSIILVALSSLRSWRRVLLFNFATEELIGELTAEFVSSAPVKSEEEKITSRHR